MELFLVAKNRVGRRFPEIEVRILGKGLIAVIESDQGISIRVDEIYPKELKQLLIIAENFKMLTSSLPVEKETKEENKQVLRNESRVTFNVKELLEELVEDEDILESQMRKLDGQKATVICLETATELGRLDFEYYNIVFNDGTELIGISGYHLTPDEL